MKLFGVAAIFLGQLTLILAQSACDSTACFNGGSFVASGNTLSCKCKTPFAGTRCQNGCNIQLLAWGYNDPPLKSGGVSADANGYAIVNGQKVLTTKDGGGTYARGVMVLTLDSLTCAVQGTTRVFDPFGNAADTTNFNNYVNGIANGTLLVVVTADEPHNNFGGAVSTVKALGGPDISDANLDYRGKFAFVTQKGYPAKGQGKVAKGGGAHLTLNVNVSGTTQADVTITPA